MLFIEGEKKTVLTGAGLKYYEKAERHKIIQVLLSFLLD